MAKFLDATCENGIVKVSGKTISDAIVLSAGVASSVGVLLLQGGNSYYIASSAGDLNTSLEKIISALSKISETFTSLGPVFSSFAASMTGPTTAPPPTLAVDLISLNLKVTELTAIKTELEVLNGELT